MKPSALLDVIDAFVAGAVRAVGELGLVIVAGDDRCFVEDAVLEGECRAPTVFVVLSLVAVDVVGVSFATTVSG
ncbi:MAG: hypothetical protein K0U66_02580 [Gammaproteobacteria bacterium]|nr:hypothetical protein [Gammaproteobacteria bacterium]